MMDHHDSMILGLQSMKQQIRKEFKIEQMKELLEYDFMETMIDDYLNDKQIERTDGMDDVND